MRFLATIAAFILSAAALAQPAPDADALWRLTANIPDDAHALIYVRAPLTLLETQDQSTVHTLATQAGFLRESFASWTNLAKRLELDPEDLFRRVAGAGVLYISFGHGDGGMAPDRSWAVASLVAADTARILRTKLDAIPKAIVDEQPVLSIENGRYALVLRPVVPMDPHSVQVLLFSPWDAGGGGASLALQRMVAAVNGGEIDPKQKTLSSFQNWRDAREHARAADAVVLLRGESLSLGTPVTSVQPRDDTWDHAVFIRADLKPSAWSFQGWERPAPAFESTRILPTTLAAKFEPWQSERGGASVAILDCGARKLAGTTPGKILTLGGNLGAPTIHPSDGPFLFALRPEHPDDPDTFAGSSAVFASREPGPLDERAAGMIRVIEQGGKPLDTTLFNTLDPAATRVVPLTLKPGMPMMPILGESPSAAWWHARDDWNVWCFTPRADAIGNDAHDERSIRTLRASTDTLLATPGAITPGDDRRWLTRVALRPNRFIESLHPTMRLALFAFAVCDSVRYDAWLTPDDRLAVRIDVAWTTPKTKKK